MGDYTALNSKMKKQFYEKLREYFGLPSDFTFDGMLFVSSKNRYFLLDEKYLEYMEAGYRIKVMGVYIAEISQFGEIRMSIEGSQLIGPFATKHVLELNDAQIELFIRGEDLEINKMVQEKNLNNQFYIINHIDASGAKDFFGCAKIKEGKLFNFTPKNRRVRD